MLFEIITMMSMLLVWKTTRSLMITSILSFIWCYTIPPFGFWLGSWVSWGVMWELSSLEFISTTTARCSRKNGGMMEMFPGRLEFKDWLIHHGCVGRANGHDHPIYGNLVLLALPFVVIAFVSIFRVISKYVPYFNRFYPHVQAFFSVLAGIISFLAELFVVTKPVELSQGVLVDTVTYDHLVHEKDQMIERVLDFEAELERLGTIVDWCHIYHANPDATSMKVQQYQLATTQQQLDRLRREYVQLQNRCQVLEDAKEDVRHTDVGALRNTIASQESENLALKITINALEARPDTETMKAEKKRAEGLQQKLDDQIKEATAGEIKAGLEREELEKLRTSNKSLRSENKAAEMRAQLVASCHNKAMEEMKKKMEEAEAAVVGLQCQLGKAQDEVSATNAANTINAANATIQRLQQELEGVKERVAAEILVARKELTEAAEAELNARILAARKELVEAAEAEIKSRVDERLQSAVNEALALRDVALATMDDIPFGDDDPEFTNIAAECQQREDARQAEAAAATTTSSNMDTEMCTENPASAAPTVSLASAPVVFVAGQSSPAAAPISFSPAPVAFVPKIPGLGIEYHPQHVVAHAKARAAAAAMAALEAGKFFEQEYPDINKPFQGERQRAESHNDDDDDYELFKDLYEPESGY